MTIDDKIRDEKLLYDINRKAVKMSALSSNKNNLRSRNKTNSSFKSFKTRRKLRTFCKKDEK